MKKYKKKKLKPWYEKNNKIFVVPTQRYYDYIILY